MKPLYWTRIQIPANLAPPPPSVPTADSSEDDINNSTLWEKLEEAPPESWEEFENLFSRQPNGKKTTAKIKIASKAKQVAKLLDQKRSQNVGILINSKRLDINDVENAVYNFDTSIVSLDFLQSIYDVRPSPEELNMIKAHVDLQNEIPLDKPEQFLLDLSGIPEFADRVACIMFQEEFSESISNTDLKLNNMATICKVLTTGENVQRVLAIVLALGNYMNASNRTRGQADGFGLEILGKLRDVKSKDNSITLLHYIARNYIEKYQADATFATAVFPVIEPSDMEKASLTNFDDAATDLAKMKTQIVICERRVTKVLEASNEEHQQPFKDKMETFLTQANKEHQEQEVSLEECRVKFKATLTFFGYKAKASKEAEWPKEFFTLWLPFCNDFKNIWKKEMDRKFKLETEMIKKKLQEIDQKKKLTKTKVIKKSSGTLKARLAHKGLIKE